MYPLSLGELFTIQQRVTGATFDGTDRGRASALLPAFSGGTQLRVRSRLYGSASNAYQVELVDRGAGQNVAETTAFLESTVAKVVLRRTALGGIQATPQEVVDAINRVQEAAFPVRAELVGSGSALAGAIAPTALTGGADPTRVGCRGLLFDTEYVGVSAGFFHFEHDQPVLIRKVECEFVSPPTADVYFYTVNLTPAYSEVAGQRCETWVEPISSAEPGRGLADVNIVLLPEQALVCAFAASGLVRVTARLATRYPYP